MMNYIKGGPTRITGALPKLIDHIKEADSNKSAYKLANETPEITVMQAGSKQPPVVINFNN